MNEINNEINIINECLRGNSEAFRDLIMNYEKAVYATAFYYVKSSSVAKEITQDAFISAFKNLSQLKDFTRFGKWLKEITTRLSLQYIQKNKEIFSDYEEEKIIPLNQKNDIYKSYNLPFDEIKSAIEQLPERYRLPVVLKFLEGMNYEEISRFTGESPGEIKGILYRAVKQLQEIIGGNNGEMQEWHDVRK